MRNRVSKWTDFWANRYAVSGYATNYGAHLYRLEVLYTVMHIAYRFLMALSMLSFPSVGPVSPRTKALPWSLPGWLGQMES